MYGLPKIQIYKLNCPLKPIVSQIDFPSAEKLQRIYHIYYKIPQKIYNALTTYRYYRM